MSQADLAAIADAVAGMPARIAADLGALHPENLANRERSMQVLNLALTVADDAVRDEIEDLAAASELDGVAWYDTRCAPYDVRHPDDRAYCLERVQRALKYIGLRDAGSAPWMFHRHPQHAHLVRFETRR